MSELKVQNFNQPGGSIQVIGAQGLDAKLVSSMKRRAQIGAAMDRVAPYRYNPFIQQQNLDIPQDYKVRNAFKRYFFKTNPLVGSALELNAEFPLSDFHLQHDDPAVEEFLNDILDETCFFELLIQASLEYNLIGEFNWFSFFDDVDNPATYTGFVLLDPDKVEVVGSNFVQGHSKENMYLMMDPTVQRIVDGGPMHPVTGQLYQHLPADILNCARTRTPLALSNLQASRVKRGNYFSQRGESVLERIFDLLMYKSKLRSAQYEIANRQISPTELFLIGETGDPADQAELDNFREILAQTYMDVNKAVVYHHALRYEAVGTQGKLMNLWAEFDGVDNEIMAGLMVNKGLIYGDAGSFATSVVQLNLLINRYLMYRKKIEKWILTAIIGPLLKIHEIYVPESKVKSGYFREMCGKGRPLSFPTIKWEKESLQDESAKMELLANLVDKKVVPEENLLRLLNLDPKVVAQKLDDEMMSKAERKQKMLQKLKAKGIPITVEFAQYLGLGNGEGAPIPGSGELPMSIGSGGGGMPSPMGGGLGLTEPGVADLPEAVPGAQGEGGATGGLAKDDNLQGQPSESHLPVGLDVS